MDSHLVTIKVSVKCCTNKWVKPHSATFNKHWFKGLD